MRIFFLICLFLAVAFIVSAAATALLGFSKISKDEEKEKKEREEQEHHTESDAIDEQSRIVFHEEEDGI